MNNFMHGKNFLSLMEEAKNGNTDAQIELGDRYFDGDGISKNIDLSIKWYKKAAEQGSADAQFELAVIYEDDEILFGNGRVEEANIIFDKFGTVGRFLRED